MARGIHVKIILPDGKRGAGEITPENHTFLEILEDIVKEFELPQGSYTIFIPIIEGMTLEVVNVTGRKVARLQVEVRPDGLVKAVE